MKFFTRLIGEDRGAGLVEYGMIVSIISLMSFSAVQLVGHSTEDTFTEVAQAVDHEATDGSGNGGSVESSSGDSASSGGSGATTSTTTPATPSSTAAPATTTTTTPATTTTTSPATTTTAPPATTTSTAGGDGSGDDNGSGASDSAPAPGSQSTLTDTSSEFTWWNTTNHGGSGEWKASVTFSNDWVRHQYLELEVTQIDDKGRTSTTVIDSFYVPAGGTTTFNHWGNVLKDHKGRVTGVMQVEVKVLEVRTSDENWQPMTYPQDGQATVVSAPRVP